MQTKPFIGEYNNSKILKIWKVDEAGNPTGKSPVVAMGATKIRVILEHIDVLQEFLNLVDGEELKKEVVEDKPFGA